VAKFFTYPVVGEIIKKFSSSELQYSVTYNDMRLHPGIDIKVGSGTAVKSAGDGVVLSVENDQNLGYTVKIDHGNGVTGVYAGLTKAVAVKKGDIVKSGSTIGAVGTVTNECLDAPHLHLEFLKDEKQIDPLSLLSE
jgi:murein DD-endopeptidase MepM/ murein hydrolase activator NlpD